MALRLSTALRDALNSKSVDTRLAMEDQSTISFDHDEENKDKILDSEGGFKDAGIKTNDVILIQGASNTENNGVFVVDNAATGELTLEEGVNIVDESAGQDITIKVLVGGSWKDVFRDGVMRIYSGSQPSNANDGETGTLLLEITRNSNEFDPENPQNGLNFGQSSDGVVNKRSDEIWSGVGIESGTAGWFRFYCNKRNTGSTEESIRFDGACATSGGELNMSSTSIVAGATTTIDSFNINLPASS